MERLTGFTTKWFFKEITVSRRELEEYQRRQALLAWVCPVCQRVWMKKGEIDIFFWVAEHWMEDGKVIMSSHVNKQKKHCEGEVKLAERPDAQAAFLIGGPDAVKDLGE